MRLSATQRATPSASPSVNNGRTAMKFDDLLPVDRFIATLEIVEREGAGSL
jgi:hypothetical protein